jgi:hypothetical protein|nr:MAG TPA_asm: 3'-5' exonuclease [Caudoviricetes sp.]
MNVAIIDTETTKNNMVYDLGVAILNTSTGEIVDTMNAVVSETFGNVAAMRTAYYASKIPQYLAAIDAGELEVLAFSDCFKRFGALLAAHGVRSVWAYNMAFDYKALNRTISELSNGFVGCFFPDNVKCYDLMSSAINLVGNTRRYQSWALEHGYVTPTGRAKATAEIMFRFVTDDNAFIEDHTALSDAMVEADILAHLVAKKAGYKRHGEKWGAKVQMR